MKIIRDPRCRFCKRRFDKSKQIFQDEVDPSRCNTCAWNYERLVDRNEDHMMVMNALGVPDIHGEPYTRYRS